MRINSTILLNVGLSAAVVFCTVMAVMVGLESQRTPHTESLEPVVFSPYEAPATESDVAVEAFAEPDEVAPGQSSAKSVRKLKPAVLQVVTNFDKADVSINGIPYPEYTDPGQPEGIVLPAGGPYDVRVTYAGKVKAYNLYLKANETRLLFVELSGFQGGNAAPAPASKPQPKPEEPKTEEKKEDAAKEPGKVTVYSKPAGTIIVDGNKQTEKTPGTVEVSNGRHEVQVEYEGGEISEKKIVRVRDGSRIKLFFRQRTATE